MVAVVDGGGSEDWEENDEKERERIRGKKKYDRKNGSGSDTMIKKEEIFFIFLYFNILDSHDKTSYPTNWVGWIWSTSSIQSSVSTAAAARERCFCAASPFWKPSISTSKPFSSARSCVKSIGNP